MFTCKTKIRMHHTDAAGRLFFGHQFAICHEAYEDFLEHIGLPFAKILKETNYFVPIIHAEADYKKPLYVGDVIDIELNVVEIGETSFKIGYVFKDPSGEVVGSVITVHVVVDNQTRQKTPLPEYLRDKLTAAKA